MSPESSTGLLNVTRERESLSKQTNHWETTVRSQLDDCQIEIEIEIETVSRRMKKIKRVLGICLSGRVERAGQLVSGLYKRVCKGVWECECVCESVAKAKVSN